MGIVSLMAFVTLAATPAGRDAGVARDAVPAWVPRSNRVDLEEAVAYPLRRSGDGYVYEAPTFGAHVGRDGVVTFKDKRAGVDSLLSPFGKLPRPKGPTLESTVRDRFRKRRPTVEPPEPSTPPPVPPGIDWEYLCPPGSSCDTRPLPTLIQVRGKFDLTDEIMRAIGQHPYAREKARFLSSTFDFRIRLAVDARKQDVQAALEHLPERLEALWADQRYSARERRRLLYELWWEMDGSADGQRAAAAITGFIRRRLPCGSPSGYTAEELATFQRWHPQRRFLTPAECPAPPP